MEFRTIPKEVRTAKDAAIYQERIGVIMENPATNNLPEIPLPLSQKFSVIGFILMILGPSILILTGIFAGTLNLVLSKVIAFTIMWIAIILPGIGVILSIISLVLCSKSGRSKHALSIVTLLACNPVFYIYYLVICLMTGNGLAGLPTM